MEIEQPAVLAVFSTIGAAQMVATELRARGIPCEIVTDDAGGMYPALQLGEGVKIVVADANLELARQLLAAAPIEAARLPDSDLAPEPAPTAKPSRLYFGWGLLAGLILGAAAMWAYDQHRRSNDYTYSVDNNDDGRADEFWTYRGGQLTADTKDRNFDGKIDYWGFWKDGRIERSESDDNFDGKVDNWSSYTNGNSSVSIVDNDFNGLSDATCYFSNGILRKMEWRTNQCALVTKEAWYENGILMEEFRDEDGDGQFDVQVTFDAFVNPIRTNLLPKKLLINR